MKISFLKRKNINTSPIKELALVLFLCLVGLAMHLGVKAQDSDTVTATVTAQQISVSVSDGSVAYGILDIGSTMTTLALDPIDTQSASNDGNVAVNFGIQGTTSAEWSLAATPGDETYAHEISTDSGTGWTAMETGSYTEFAAAVGTGETEPFDLNIHIPTSTTATTEQSVNVSVQATAN